jgi:hypothetical protein
VGMRRLAGIVAGAVAFLGTVALAGAGGATDPRPGDALLGKDGGVAYVSDPEFAAAASSVQAATACPNLPSSKWRIVGGGFSLVGGADSGQLVAGSHPADLDDEEFGDDDLALDDWWRVSADVSIGTTVTSYAICTKWDKLKYKNKAVPNSPSGERSHVVKCGRGKVSGGGGSISTSNSYVSSMFPRKGKRWKFSAYDTTGGIGGMNNYVICARGRDFQIVKDEVSVPAGGSSVLLAAECFPGQSVVGGGAKSSGAPGTLSLRASQPYDTSDPDSIPSNGWAVRAFSTDPGAQTLKVFAICHG